MGGLKFPRMVVPVHQKRTLQKSLYQWLMGEVPVSPVSSGFLGLFLPCK